MKRGVPIPPASKEVVQARCKGRCEARLAGCCGDGDQYHHVKSRKRGGSNDPKNLLYVCWKCHHKITTHAPGTARFRTHSYQPEGSTEADWERQFKESP